MSFCKNSFYRVIDVWVEGRYKGYKYKLNYVVQDEKPRRVVRLTKLLRKTFFVWIVILVD